VSDTLNRRSFVDRIGRLASTFPLTALAQQVRPSGVKRIGFLTGSEQIGIAAFKSELSKLGYIEGRNLAIEMRITRRNSSDVVSYAAELGRMDVELVVVAALPQALEMRKANPAMPMVIGTCPGMVSNGFAASLERPGGHVTGMDELPPGVTAKRLTLLKTAARAVSRIALLSTTPGRGGYETQLADAESAAAGLGVGVKSYRAASLNELEAALTAIANDGMNGLANFQGGTLACQPPAHSRLRRQARATRELPGNSVRRSRRSDGLGAGPRRAVYSSGALCRSNPEGRQSGRTASPLSLSILSDDQQQCRQGPRTDHSANTAGAGRPCLALTGRHNDATPLPPISNHARRPCRLSVLQKHAAMRNMRSASKC
jgi:putative tryptophan/tyrosine transport system substrate-binding protein